MLPVGALQTKLLCLHVERMTATLLSCLCGYHVWSLRMCVPCADMTSMPAPQLDLHGLHVEEALERLEHHLVTLGGLGSPGGILLQVKSARTASSALVANTLSCQSCCHRLRLVTNGACHSCALASLAADSTDPNLHPAPTSLCPSS